MCFLSSFPGQDLLSTNTNYYLALCGMAFNGLGGYGMTLTTEISDAWFDESTRLVVNTLIQIHMANQYKTENTFSITPK